MAVQQKNPKKLIFGIVLLIIGVIIIVSGLT